MFEHSIFQTQNNGRNMTSNNGIVHFRNQIFPNFSPFAQEVVPAAQSNARQVSSSAAISSASEAAPSPMNAPPAQASGKDETMLRHIEFLKNLQKIIQEDKRSNIPGRPLGVKHDIFAKHRQESGVSTSLIKNIASTPAKEVRFSGEMLTAENAKPGVCFYRSNPRVENNNAKRLISKIFEVNAAPCKFDLGRVLVFYTLENVPHAKLTAYIGSQSYLKNLGLESGWVIVPEAV